KLRCGLTKDRNLISGEREKLTSFESMELNLPASGKIYKGYLVIDKAMGMPLACALLRDATLASIWLPQDPRRTRSSSTNRYRKRPRTAARFACRFEAIAMCACPGIWHGSRVS